MDRLSSLPDHVLGHILSFLNTDSTVQTSVLSSRWRYVYTFSTSIDFGHTRFDKPSFIDILNRILMQHNVNIKKFSLWWPYYTMDASYVNSWIATAVTRSVEVLDLIFEGSSEYNPKFDWAPDCLFVSQTLVTFMVSGDRLILRIPSLVWLPSLKTLRLEGIQTLDSSSMTRLCKGCPLLQNLSISYCWVTAGQDYTISSAMLRRLCIVHTWFDSFHMTPKVEFDVPRLEYFEFDGQVRELYSIKSSNTLAIVRITVVQLLKLALVYSLIRSVSNARTVKLFDTRTIKEEVQSEEVEVCSSRAALPELPIFGNLSYLEIGILSPDPRGLLSKILQHLLTSSPNLETLVFRKGFQHCCNDIKEFVQSQTFTWPSHLKVIQVHAFSGSAEEVEMVTWFLSKAVGLKQLNVHAAVATEGRRTKAVECECGCDDI